LAVGAFVPGDDEAAAGFVPAGATDPLPEPAAAPPAAPAPIGAPIGAAADESSADRGAIMGADAAGAAPAGEELTAAADSPLPTPRTPPALPGVAVPADEPGDTTGAPPTVLDVESSTASRPAVDEVGEDPEGADDISDDSAPVADSVAPGD
jgi:hypothetical protein